jgi:hypothetical protein
MSIGVLVSVAVGLCVAVAARVAVGVVFSVDVGVASLVTSLTTGGWSKDDVHAINGDDGDRNH